jgi:hypothetical protein
MTERQIALKDRISDLMEIMSKRAFSLIDALCFYGRYTRLRLQQARARLSGKVVSGSGQLRMVSHKQDTALL